MANTTWNPSDKTATITLSGSNLVATATAGGAWVRTIDRQVSGKFYWEITCTTFVNNTSEVGICNTSLATPTSAGIGGAGLTRVGTLRIDGANIITTFGTITSGTVVCFAVDFGARLLWVRLGAAGNWNVATTANPATGTGGASIPSLGSGLPALAYYLGGQNLDAVTANFGDSAFVGTVPSGFTSGFTSGVTTSTNVIATQVATEEWLTNNVPVQVTQVAIEEWVQRPPPEVDISGFARENLITSASNPTQLLLAGIVREVLVPSFKASKGRFVWFPTDDETLSEGLVWYPRRHPPVLAAVAPVQITRVHFPIDDEIPPDEIVWYPSVIRRTMPHFVSPGRLRPYFAISST